MKKIKNDIESAFSDYAGQWESNDGVMASDFEDLLRDTQFQMPDWDLTNVALFDPSIELPEGTDPTAYVVRIPTMAEDSTIVNEMTIDELEMDLDKDVEPLIKIEPDEITEKLQEIAEVEDTMEVEEEIQEEIIEPKRMRLISSSAGWPRVVVSRENAKLWSKDLEEASSHIYFSNKTRKLSYSPMSPDFSEKSESPEHSMEYDEDMKTRNDQLVTPPDTPPPSVHDIENDFDDRAREQMLSRIETGKIKPVKTIVRPKRVAIETFDVPFLFSRKRRHHSRDNCLKRGVILYHVEKCSSCQVYQEIKNTLDFSMVRSIQEVETSKFLIIMNREDDRNKFIKAIKKEKRKGDWSATTIDNSIYQEIDAKMNYIMSKFVYKDKIHL